MSKHVGGPKLLLTQGFVPTFSPLSSSVLSSTESRIRFHRQSISVRKPFIAGVAAESACWGFESSYSKPNLLACPSLIMTGQMAASWSNTCYTPATQMPSPSGFLADYRSPFRAAGNAVLLATLAACTTLLAASLTRQVHQAAGMAVC